MLDTPITHLSGIGKARADVLGAKLGLASYADVLFGFPRTYKDFCLVLSPDQAELGQEGLFFGTLTKVQEKHVGKGRRLIQADLIGQRKSVALSWFTTARGKRESHLVQRLTTVRELWVHGLVRRGYRGLEICGGEWHAKKPRLALHPVYPLVKGVTNAMRIKWVEQVISRIGGLDDLVPQSFCTHELTRWEAITTLHFPADRRVLQIARDQIVLEELILFQLGLWRASTRQPLRSNKRDGHLVARFMTTLPFELTSGQRTAMADIRRDMESDSQMRRLLHGDVGSGKTVVAEYAAVKAVENGGQVAMMVPTEVLARQMHHRLTWSLADLEIQVGLLVGRLNDRERNALIERMAQGSVHVVVGTHALISDDVVFHDLSLTIVDEQHRFGVHQRLALGDKGNADLLVMSATPIPRSLALTLYGDLDVSRIVDLPEGRAPIDTRLIHPSRRLDVYRFVVDRVNKGEQAYVVFPLVEESDKLALRAAVTEMEALRTGPLKGLRVGLIHGQMKLDKAEMVFQFAQGDIDVLVCTTVIEVGVNTPKATVMVIEEADRFGLAQLHQLRGRVGRSQRQSYCFLIADPSTDMARQRLQTMRQTTDGFCIAEEDLRLRGPGDLLGTRQSGQPMFRLANLLTDRHILERAAGVARAVICHDPNKTRFPQLWLEVNRQRRR